MQAIIEDVVIAQSDETIVIEGNHYFPPDSVRRELLSASELSTVCPWKGTAGYYDVTVGETRLTNGAWYYPAPMDAAAEIKDYVAFGAPITVTD